MPISSNFTSVSSKDWEINFTQCAPNGFLKYTELCNLLQLTAAAHSEIGGISFTDMQEFHQAWVLSRMRVEVLELPKWRDIVTVKTWINSLENSRSVRALEMYVNGKKIIGSETFWAVFNTQTRRPEALALPYEHFELFPNEKATKNSFSKIDISKYLEWCLDLVDENLILNQNIDSFEMNFLKELSLGDKIVLHECITERATIFSITNDEKTSCALQLNWK